MIINSKKDLKKFLENAISNCKGKVIIQSGHFALIHTKKTNKLIPSIYQDIKNKEQKEGIKAHLYMGEFPKKTFELGVQLINFAREQHKIFGMTLIVNDWQWVTKMEGGEINPYRNKFYKENKLPKSYNKILTKYGFNSKVIISMKDEKQGKLFFSEQKLRNKYRKFKKICDLRENACAQEYIPFLEQIIKQNTKLIISFIPKTCQIPINTSSKEAKNKFKSNIKIINIFANGME